MNCREYLVKTLDFDEDCFKLYHTLIRKPSYSDGDLKRLSVEMFGECKSSEVVRKFGLINLVGYRNLDRSKIRFTSAVSRKCRCGVSYVPNFHDCLCDFERDIEFLTHKLEVDLDSTSIEFTDLDVDMWLNFKKKWLRND